MPLVFDDNRKYRHRRFKADDYVDTELNRQLDSQLPGASADYSGPRFRGPKPTTAVLSGEALTNEAYRRLSQPIIDLPPDAVMRPGSQERQPAKRGKPMVFTPIRDPRDDAIRRNAGSPPAPGAVRDATPRASSGYFTSAEGQPSPGEIMKKAGVVITPEQRKFIEQYYPGVFSEVPAGHIRAAAEGRYKPTAPDEQGPRSYQDVLDRAYRGTGRRAPIATAEEEERWRDRERDKLDRRRELRGDRLDTGRVRITGHNGEVTEIRSDEIGTEAGKEKARGAVERGGLATGTQTIRVGGKNYRIPAWMDARSFQEHVTRYFTGTEGNYRQMNPDEAVENTLDDFHKAAGVDPDRRAGIITDQGETPLDAHLNRKALDRAQRKADKDGKPVQVDIPAGRGGGDLARFILPTFKHKASGMKEKGLTKDQFDKQQAELKANSDKIRDITREKGYKGGAKEIAALRKQRKMVQERYQKIARDNLGESRRAEAKARKDGTLTDAIGPPGMDSHKTYRQQQADAAAEARAESSRQRRYRVRKSRSQVAAEKKAIKEARKEAADREKRFRGNQAKLMETGVEEIEAEIKDEEDRFNVRESEIKAALVVMAKNAADSDSEVDAEKRQGYLDELEAARKKVKGLRRVLLDRKHRIKEILTIAPISGGRFSRKRPPSQYEVDSMIEALRARKILTMWQEDTFWSLPKKEREELKRRFQGGEL